MGSRTADVWSSEGPSELTARMIRLVTPQRRTQAHPHRDNPSITLPARAPLVPAESSRDDSKDFARGVNHPNLFEPRVRRIILKYESSGGVRRRLRQHIIRDRVLRRNREPLRLTTREWHADER